MGTPIPPPFVPGPVAPGDDYIECWGIGKPFGDGDTPDRVTVSISGVNKGPAWGGLDGEPVNGVFELLQVAGSPNIFRLTQDPFIMAVEWEIPVSTFLVITGPAIFQFVATPAGNCNTEFTNELFEKFIGGTAVITIPGIA